MAGDISIRLDDTTVTKKLKQLERGVKSFKEPLSKAGDDLIDFYGKKVFKTQGSAIGERWKPLSAATLKMRQNRRGHYAKTPVRRGKILIWTGELQRGFTKKVKSTRLVIRNTVDYFKYHQKGDRKMLAINKKVIKIVVKNLNKYISKIVNK